MLINWFTVGAQVLNFIVLVWLLKRFLYGPVLNAIEAREKRVAAELNVHPNTLDHRLTRIEALLDLSLNDVAWLARLQVALQLWARGVEKTPR